MELLDDVHIKNQKKPIFSCIAIIMPMMFIYMLYFIGTSMIKDEIVANETIIFILTISFFVFGVLSVLFSFIRKEEPKALRFIGGTINLFLVASIIISIFLL
jgi:hypothetical protein